MIRGWNVGGRDGYVVDPAAVHDGSDDRRSGRSIGELCIKRLLAIHLDTLNGKNSIARYEAGVCCWTALSYLDYLEAVHAIN